MKFYELLRKVEFDALEPYLGNSALYKCAYDILRNTEVEENDGRIVLYLSAEKDFDGNDFICVSEECEGDLWPRNLGKEIVFEGGIELSDEELLSKILWSCTFLGFTPKHRQTFDMSPRNKYEKAYWDMYYNRTKQYMDIVDKKLFLDGEMYGNYHESLKSNYCRNRNRKPPKQGNRSKRKRDYRQKHRMKTLKRLGEVEEVIKMLVADGSSLTRQQLDWLFMTENISHIHTKRKTECHICTNF